MKNSFAELPEETNAKPEYRKLPLGDQELALSLLHETISELERRLNLILLPEDTVTTESKDGYYEEKMSPLASHMAMTTRSINLATNKLGALLERVEC